MVKICGLQSPGVALVAAEAGADFLGLVFVEASRRSVSIDLAKSIIKAVRTRPVSTTSAPHSPLPTSHSADWFALQSARLASHPRKPLFVGVFQNPTLEYLLRTVDELALDVVQLHGNEPVEWARLVSVPVIQVFHVAATSEGPAAEESLLKNATRSGYHSLALLDTMVGTGGMSGGAGKTFDWDVAGKLIECRGQGQGRLPVLLAGGMDAENVKTAIQQVHPWGIDISGGVETGGVKDMDKIRAFIKAVKE